MYHSRPCSECDTKGIFADRSVCPCCSGLGYLLVEDGDDEDDLSERDQLQV